MTSFEIRLYLHIANQALENIAHMVKTYIQYFIVYNSSLHHAIHKLKSIAHIMVNQRKLKIICTKYE